jgi:hypothetical protein
MHQAVILRHLTAEARLDKATLGQVFLRVLRFAIASIIPLMPRILFTYHRHYKMLLIVTIVK